MRNTILTAMFLMMVPEMASAQFYTITKETEIKLIQASDKEKSIDNKKDTTPIGSNNEPKDTLKVQPDIRTSKRPYTQKWTVRHPKNLSELNQTVIFLN